MNSLSYQLTCACVCVCVCARVSVGLFVAVWLVLPSLSRSISSRLSLTHPPYSFVNDQTLPLKNSKERKRK